MTGSIAAMVFPDHAQRPAASSSPAPAHHLAGVHLSGAMQPATSSFEVTGGRTTITARGVEHRIVVNHLRRRRAELPSPQPLDDPGRLLRIAQIRPPGPIALTTGGAGSNVKLIEQPDASLRRTLGIRQAEISHGRR